MKNILKSFLLLLLLAIPFACDDIDDNAVPSNLRVNDFVWKGMNLYYLWQADVTDLADNRFANQDQLNTFLTDYSSPIDLFNSLRVDNTLDRFSVIFSDYRVLEGILSGNTKNNGMDFGLRYKTGSTTDIFGWVRYIIPNSDAATKNIQRGAIFYAINGTPLTIDNYQSLLNSDTYSIDLAEYDNGNITPNGQSLSLTKTALAENPILINTVINQGNHKIGYLMYNGFYASYDYQLNAAFGQMQSANITDLVLDLRYNSGGSIRTATRLASMITGQFNGQLFAKEQWNAKAQAYYEDTNPGNLKNNFSNSIGTTSINSLHLNKIYILTSKSTASASELIINCLKPYIDVIQIGDTTTGKNVGSITLYDTPTFTKSDALGSHYYAMQPIVLKIVNKNGFGDYTSGLAPNYPLVENLGNLNTLGNISEPLLSTAIGLITANGRMLQQNPLLLERDFEDTKSLSPLRSEMYKEQN
jgi:carboxyl-terminal processing protease